MPLLGNGLSERIRGDVRFGEPLASYTTYRIGGPALALVTPTSAEDVGAAIAYARDEGLPWFALGLGSNLLVHDDGFPGVVLRIGRALGVAAPGADPTRWRVGAGVPTPLLARRTAQAGLAGVHRLVGVPGTVGGGVFMNAGAHGQEFREVVRAVDMMTADGEIETRSATEIAWDYRSSGLGRVVVLSTEIALTPEDPTRLRSEVREHLRWRKAGTPFQQPCCGSVFRNPPSPVGEYRTAGQLLDAAGLKGRRVGGAEVSRQHANYIVNTGEASAADVRRLIDDARATVQREFGVELAREVQFLP